MASRSRSTAVLDHGLDTDPSLVQEVREKLLLQAELAVKIETHARFMKEGDWVAALDTAYAKTGTEAKEIWLNRLAGIHGDGHRSRDPSRPPALSIKQCFADYLGTKTWMFQFLNHADTTAKISWNHALHRVLEKKPNTRVDLSGFHFPDGNVFYQLDLSGLDLLYINVENANFRQARLRGTSLEGAFLKGARFQCQRMFHVSMVGAYLDGASFDGAKLVHTDLSDAHGDDISFRQIRFRYCTLRNLDLGKATYLTTKDLATTNLKGVTLPDKVTFDTTFSERTAQTARNTFIFLLTLSLFAFLTVLGIDDVSMMKSKADYSVFANFKITLPILSIKVDLWHFLIWMPTLLSGLFLYFLAYLDTLFDEYADLPEVFPDGRYVVRRVFPWFLNDVVLFVMGEKGLGPVSFFRRFLALVSALIMVPGLILVFWYKYLTLHNPWSFFILALFFISSRICISYAQRAYTVLNNRKDPVLKTFWRLGWTFRPFSIVIYVAVGYLSFVNYQILWKEGKGYPYSLFALDVSYKDFVPADPSNWQKEKESVDSIPLDRGAHWKDKNLKNLKAPEAYFINSVFQDARLNYADLSGARFHRSNFVKAHFNGANLLDTLLYDVQAQGSHFHEAELKGTDMRESDFSDAVFLGASLIDVVLENTVFTGADLSVKNFLPKDGLAKDLDFTNANFALEGKGRVFLVRCDFSGSDFASATMQKVALDGSKLIGSSLLHAHLEDASLWSTDLSGADLTEAHLDRANVLFANFFMTDLSGARLTRLNNWDRADFTLANIYGVRDAPEGFQAFALSRGAVSFPAERWDTFKGWMDLVVQVIPWGAR